MRHLLATFAATGVIQLGNLASGILAARLLMPDGRGELAAIMLWPALLAAFGGMSINAAAAYFAARGDDRPAEIFAASTWISTALSVGLIVVGIAIIPFVYANYSPIAFVSAAIYLLFIPLNLFGLCYLAILQGRLRLGMFNVLRTVLPISYVIFILVALAVDRAHVLGFTVAFLGANAMVLALALVFLIRLGWAGLRTTRSLMRRMRRYAIGNHLGFAITVLSQRIDQALISLLLAPSLLGLYAVALAAGSAGALIGGTMDMVAFPKIAAAGDAASRAAIAARYARATTVLAALSAVVLIPLLPWLIELFFGSAFRPAVDTARILALAAVPLGLKTALYAGLRGAGRPFVVARVEAAVLVVLAVALALLLPRYAIVGAAWSIVIAHTLGCVIAGMRVRRELGLGWADLLVPTGEEMTRLFRLLRLARS